MAIALSSGSEDGETDKPTVRGPACTARVAAGANLSHALRQAAPGAVLCLRSGRYPGTRVPARATNKREYVTIRSAPGQSAVITGELAFDNARHVRLQELHFKNGVAFVPAASDVELIGNDLTGPGGMFFFGDPSQGGKVESVLIEDNYIHDIDYTGPQAVYRGYGIKSIGRQSGFVVRGNTIESVAADYLQTDVASDWTVDGNTFLGPSLVSGHPQEHQDLWQVYAGGKDLEFVNNVARNTGTSQSLLFQMSYPGNRFSNVVVENNLFDHDSRGYSCQIYQASGLVFRDNTIIGSRWGCLFREDPRFADGSDYVVGHNVFAETEDGSDITVDKGVADSGVFDYNVSSDDSAPGAHSVRGWRPDWANTVDYQPLGLPFGAGYIPD